MSIERKYLEDFINRFYRGNIVSLPAVKTDSTYLRRMLECEREPLANGMNDAADLLTIDSSFAVNIGCDEVKDSSSDGDMEERPNEHLLLSDIISKDSRAVILGNPGSGKTTVLLKEAVNIARQRLLGDDVPLPVYVALKDINTDNTLGDHINALLSALNMQDGLQEGEVIFFLDGLNEVASECRKDVSHTISKLSNEAPECSIILSSRLYGYKKDYGFHEYELRNFDISSIREYIVKSTEDEKLFFLLKSNPTMMELCKTPLLLSMTVDLYKQSGQTPDMRSTLYEQFIMYQTGKMKGCSTADKKLIVDALSSLAFGMRCGGYISDRMETLVNVLSDYVPKGKGQQMAYLVLKSGLLIVNDSLSGRPYISFIHETFQEYLSARRIAVLFLSEGKFPVDVTHIQWRETMRLVGEILLERIGGKAFVSVLKTVQRRFAAISYDAIVDSHLPVFINMFSSVARVDDIVKSALDGYLMFNVHNYIVSNDKERSQERFGLLVEAMATLDNNHAGEQVLTKYDWLCEWLYHKYGISKEKAKDIDEKRLLLGEAFSKATSKNKYIH